MMDTANMLNELEELEKNAKEAASLRKNDQIAV